MRRARSAGFTLIELLLCIGVLGLLAGLSFGPNLSGRMLDKRLDGFVQEFTNDLREARYLAVTDVTPYEVRVRLSGYYIYRKAGVSWAVKKYVEWPEGIDIDTSYDDQNVTFSFSTTGIYDAFSNNTVHFMNTRGTRRNVIVSSGGRIRVE